MQVMYTTILWPTREVVSQSKHNAHAQGANPGGAQK